MVDDDGGGRAESSLPLLSRRTVLKGFGSGIALAGAGGILSACGGSIKGASSGSSGTVTVGFVTPRTGSLAGFATPDNFVVNRIKQTSQYRNGFKVGNKTYKVQIVVADSQSDPNRASQVARQLILQNHADIVVTSSAPETTNPVADVCEQQGVPCVATVVPWESWYFGRGAKQGTTFQYTTMFFFGLKEFGETFVPMWNRIPNNKVVAEMFPNDADGNAFRQGWPPILKAAGYQGVDGGAYPDGTTDYTSMISNFKQKDCQIYLNGPLPPDFNTFWKQASQQGYKPKLATVAKVLLFPADVTALGSLVDNIATDAWWVPNAPYKSSLTGETASTLAKAFESSTGKQWVQSMGSTYSLFEVAHNALTSASDPHNRKEVASKLRSMSYSGMCGPLDFAKGPVPGVAIMKPVGVQWQKGSKYPWVLNVVDNSANPSIHLTGTLKATNP